MACSAKTSDERSKIFFVAAGFAKRPSAVSLGK